MTIEGALAAIRGSYLTAVVVFGLLTFPVMLCLTLLLAAAGKTRTRTSSDATGFTVWPDRRFGVLYFIGLIVLAPSAILYAIFVPRGVVDISMSRGMQIFSPALMIAAAVVAVVGLVAGVRRRSVGHLKFTPALVEIADVLKTRTVEWNDIVDIKDHSDTKDGKRAGRSVVLCLRDGSEKVVGGLNLYVPTGVPLYWMTRHYWRHAEDRMELVDARAGDRLRDGRFDLG
ncbi:hypothetical protein ACWDTP_16255 [Mycobacterium sp. NPDC003449]